MSDKLVTPTPESEAFAAAFKTYLDGEKREFLAQADIRQWASLNDEPKTLRRKTMTMIDNRITRAISSMRENIVQRVDEGLTTQEAVDKMNGELDMKLAEYCKFQELKSLASVSGTLTVDEAQTVYMMIGESVETFNALETAAKVILTKLFSELLTHQIAARS